MSREGTIGTVRDYKSPPQSLLTLLGVQKLYISLNSLMYQKAKDVENGLHHFTHLFVPLRGIASTKTLS